MTSLKSEIAVRAIVVAALLALWHMMSFEEFVMVMLVLLFMEVVFGSGSE